MTVFILIAAALVAIAAAVLIVPLASRARSGAAPSVWTAVAVVAILAGGGGGLYAWLGNRAWTSPSASDTPRAMVGRLARHLETQPDDLDGWLMLGRSYASLEEFPLAVRAYQHADTLAKGQNVEAITGLAEALTLDDQTQLARRAGQLFERALQLDPRSPKALFYGAAVAQQRGDLKLARARFQGLLDQQPPEQVRPIIERQIASLDARIADGNAEGQGSGAAAAPGPRVRVRVTLDPRIAARAPAGAPCFVFVRIPGAAGPPLAARRVSPTFPLTVELSQADAMIQGHGIELNQDVEIVARISVSGTPQAHGGDLFGSARMHIGGATEANVEINQISP